jgi:hypothetical protein
MSNTIRIKRRTAGNSDGPATLQNAELAFNEVTNVLYYGKGTGAGNTALSVIPIAGSGYVVDLTSNQSISGVKTFTDNLIVNGSTSGKTLKLGPNTSIQLWNGTAETGSLGHTGLSLGSSTSSNIAGSFTHTGSVNMSSATQVTVPNITVSTSTGQAVNATSLTGYISSQITAGSIGTVSSVTTAFPTSVFVNPTNPITSSGTLSTSFQTQSANTVFAGPATGSNTPGFRQLVAADIPSLSSTYLPLAGGSLSGNLTVGGDLTVNGTVTTINSTTISVDDKTIEIGAVTSPTDTTAEGGGIILKGSTDKSMLWYSGIGWAFNDSLSLPVNKTLKISDGATNREIFGSWDVTASAFAVDYLLIDGGTY